MSRWIEVPDDFIVIDKEKCTGCGNCIVICGGDVLALKGKKAFVAHRENCLECGNCEVACPTDALKLLVPKGGTGIIYECG